MKLHPSVARVIVEQVGETTLPVVVYAPAPVDARGFFPDSRHKNLSIKFKPLAKGKHVEITPGRQTHVQYSGEHFGGTLNQGEYATKKRCLIISAIGYAMGGRYTAIALDHIARGGGRLMGEGYFSWQGQNASGDQAKSVERFFSRMNALFGVPNLRVPNAKQDADLFAAAGIKVEQPQQAPQEAVPAIIKDHPDLAPAVKVLTAAGADLEAEPGIQINLTKIPVDLAHQHLIQKALDDLKGAELLDYDVHYDKAGRIQGVTIMKLKESVDLLKNVAILENMKNDNGLKAKKISSSIGSGYEVVAEGTGLTFTTVDLAEGGGSIVVTDGETTRFVGDYAKGKLSETVLGLVEKIKKTNIQEVCNEALGMPVNG